MIRGGALSLARLLCGLVRVKVVALALGVSGVGVYALILQLYLTSVGIASMSLAVPIINLGRKPLVAGDYSEAGSIAGTALAVMLINYLLLAIFAVVFGQSLFAQLGIGAQASWLLLPLCIAVLFGTLSSAFWEGMSYLCDRFDAYIRVGIIGAIADMVFIAAGAWAFGLRGAILVMPLGPAAMFLAYSLLVGRELTARHVLGLMSVRLRQIPPLLAYSAMMFAALSLTNIGLTFLRSRVLIEAGATANGYLQVATSLASYLLAFVMTGFWGHLHARAAAEGDTPAVRQELAKSLDLGLLISFTGCGVAAVMAPFIIPIFYSGEFAGAADQLIAYLPGELCFQLLSMLIAYQLTVSLRRIYLALNLGYIALLVAVGTLLTPAFGGFGYVAAHVAASLVVLSAAGLLGWRKGQIGGQFLATTGMMVVTLGAICAGLLYGRQSGYSPVYMLPALLPFAFSGYLVLIRLVGGRSEPNSQFPLP